VSTFRFLTPIVIPMPATSDDSIIVSREQKAKQAKVQQLIQRVESLKLRRYVIRGAEGATIDTGEEGHQQFNTSPAFSDRIDQSHAADDSMVLWTEILGKAGEDNVQNLAVIRIAGDDALGLVERMKATKLGKFYTRYLKRYSLVRRLSNY